MLRWTIRIVVACLVLIIASAAVIHFVLRSEWLAGTILSRVSETIGLEVTAESILVGWGGGTTIRGATVKMPLRDEVILTVDRIELTHAVVPLLILTRRADIRSVEVDDPNVYLRRYEDGRWNIQDAWPRLVARLRSKKPPGGSIALPRFAVHDAWVQIMEPNEASRIVGPLNLQARPQGPVLWAFDLEAPQIAKIDSRMVPGGDWAHKASFTVEGIGPLIRDLSGVDIWPLHVAGQWRGRVLQDTLQGTIQLDRLTLGKLSAQGDALIEVTGDEVAVSPRDLVLNEPNLGDGVLRLTDGHVRITRKHVAIERLAARANTLAGQLTGRWDLESQTGELLGSWVMDVGRSVPADPKIIAPDGARSAPYGTLHASVSSSAFGRKEAQVSVTSEGETSLGTWNIAAEARGSGADWRQSQWRLMAPTFTWSRGGKRIDLAGVAGEVNVGWPTVKLVSLGLPQAQETDGRGEFNVSTRLWSADIEAGGLRLETLADRSLDVHLAAEGDDRKALVSEFRVADGTRVVMAKGQLSFRERGFQDVHLAADWPTGTTGDGQAPPGRPAGGWRLEADATGRLQPFAVRMTGLLTGRNVPLGKRTIDRVEIPVQASGNAERIQMTSPPFNLLGGQWQLSGQHEMSTGLTQIGIMAGNLSFEAAAGIAGLPLASRGRAHAQIEVAVPDFDMQQAGATGSWSAEDIEIPPLVAERARGKLRIAGGLVRFEDILLEQGDGRATANMEFRLDNPQIISLDLKTEGWSVPVEGRPVSLLADSRASLRLDVAAKTAEGEIDGSGEILWNGRRLSRVRARTVMKSQVLDVQELYAETLGGSLEGEARIPLSRWRQSTGHWQWQGIQPGQLEPWLPQLARFQGTTSGSFTAEPADERTRPPEPRRLVLDASVTGGRFGPAQVDACHVVGYLGESRLLIDEASFQVLGGRLAARVRASTHRDRYYGSTIVDFNSLNLDQIVHLIDPNVPEHPGLLTGRATILSASDIASLSGEARISLTQSDLVGNGVVQALYGALNLKFGEQQPTGTGEITVRLEGPSVVIPSFMYFNRGIEVRGAGRIADIHLGAASPVDGYAVASTRVLKDITLPGLKALDKVILSLPTGTASVKIAGTLDEAKVDVVPLPEVLGSFRRLLWAQLKPQ